MVNALLIAALIMVYTFQSFFSKTYSDNYPGHPSASCWVFTIVTGLTVAVVTFAANGFHFEAHWPTILLGVLNATVLILYDLFMIRGAVTGPYSILMVFMLSGGILIPAFTDMFFGNYPSIWQWVSIALIIISLYLVSQKKGEQKITGISFFLYCFGLFIANGLYGSLFNIQQNLTGEVEKDEMVTISFLLAAVGAAVVLLILRGKNFFADFKQNKKSGTFLVICSGIKAGAVNLLVFILPLVNVTVLYTLDNAGVLLLSVLGSFIFFKEKLSVTNLIGCALTALGLVGMVLL